MEWLWAACGRSQGQRSQGTVVRWAPEVGVLKGRLLQLRTQIEEWRQALVELAPLRLLRSLAFLDLNIDLDVTRCHRGPVNLGNAQEDKTKTDHPAQERGSPNRGE